MSPAQHGEMDSSRRDPSAVQEAAAPNLNCFSLDVCFLWFTSTPACAQGLSRLEDGHTEVRAAVPGRAAPAEMGIVHHSHPVVPQLLGCPCAAGGNAVQRWQWGHGSPSSAGMELGLQLLEGKSLGLGLCWNPPRSHITKAHEEQPGAGSNVQLCADLPQSISLTPPHPTSAMPLSKSRQLGAGGAAPLYCPRPRAPRLPSSSCCHKPHLRGDVRLLSANSRGYCCRHGAHPDKTTRGSRARLLGRGAADAGGEVAGLAVGSTGIHLLCLLFPA